MTDAHQFIWSSCDSLITSAVTSSISFRWSDFFYRPTGVAGGCVIKYLHKKIRQRNLQRDICYFSRKDVHAISQPIRGTELYLLSPVRDIISAVIYFWYLKNFAGKLDFLIYSRTTLLCKEYNLDIEHHGLMLMLYYLSSNQIVYLLSLVTNNWAILPNQYNINRLIYSG